jgi:hypothetical protein
MASINVVTGVLTGSIGSNSSFEWENPNTSGSCEVSDVGAWCTSSSYTVPAAASAGSPGKVSANTQNVSGNFSFTSPCCNAPNSRIHIGSK